MEIGSTEDGGGHLAAEFDFHDAIPVFFDRCFGGEGEEYSGGVRLYSTVNPGFSALGHDHGGHDDGHDDGHDNGHDDEHDHEH